MRARIFPVRFGIAAAIVAALLACAGASRGGIDPAVSARIDAIAAAPVNNGRAAGIVVGVIAGGDQRI
jgi:hypothetical protein